MKEVIEHLQKDERFYQISERNGKVRFKYKGRSYSIIAEKEVYVLCWVNMPVHFSSELEDITDFILI